MVSCRELDYYIHNAQFIIRIDHKPSKYLLESPMQNKKIQMWALRMSGYNCSIEYIAGTTNTCADLLSRHPDNVKKTFDVHFHDEVETQDYKTVLDVNDILYEVSVIDFNQFDPKSFANIVCEYDQEIPQSQTADNPMAPRGRAP